MYDSIIIVGATATGKTKLSIEIAKRLNTEIINADSMYIYRDLSIGTAKPTIEEMSGITHHLIGFLNTDDSYNVSQFRNDAESVLKDFKSKNLIPVIVGGTGFYIDSLIKNYSYGETTIDKSIRENLASELETFGKEHMYEKLKSIDSDTASKLHVNDTMRVLRALEIYQTSGTKKSDISNYREPLLKNPLIIGLNIPRETLYDRINNRVDIMIKNGLIVEVKNLYLQGYTPENSQAMKGIGYKELIEYFLGNCSLEYAIEKIKQHSRNYAKRQITWFKRNNDIIWYNPLEYNNLADIVIDFFKSNENI